jgi:hypothetical protein
MKGRISTQYTVWCGTCGEWDYLDVKAGVSKVKAAKAIGYKLVIEKGWVCPKCQGIPNFVPTPDPLPPGAFLLQITDTGAKRDGNPFPMKNV